MSLDMLADRYKIVQSLGEGGMADVIRVRNMVSYAKIELEMIKNEA